MMKTYRGDYGRCPTCSRVLNSSSVTIDNSPAPTSGDYTVCFYCFTWLVYSDDLKVRILTQKDVDNMSEENAKVLRELTLAFSVAKRGG